MLLRLSIICLFLVGCGPKHRPVELPGAPPMEAVYQAVDWSSAGDEAVALLSEYLRIDTRNPGGRETDGALFLAEFLRREGIESEILEYAPGRGSLVARLRGSGQGEPLCLLSHIDVVTWERESWPEDAGPLSGVVQDGELWGRGALDMKGMGAIEALTMVWLARLGVPLSRDVVLVAVADEEVDNQGARFLTEQHWDKLGCGHVVNEGGFGAEGALFDDQTIYGISVAEKGFLWVRVVAMGEPGHGSTPTPGRSPEKLLEVLDRIGARDAQVFWHPSLYELLHAAGEPRKGLEKAVLTRPAAVRSLLKGRLMGNPATAAMLTNTINLTGFDGAEEPNVEPGEVAAIFDCRVLPGQDPQAVLDELRALVGDDPDVRFDVLGMEPGNESPVQDELYAAWARHATGGAEDAVVGPIVSVGFTDSIYFRKKGARAYGFIPFRASPEVLQTMHGNRERVPVQTLQDGLGKLFRAVVDVSVQPGFAPGEAVSAPPWEPVAWQEPGAAPPDEPLPREAP